MDSRQTQAEGFEDHCWRDLIPADVLHLYRHYERPLRVGPRPALLLIDLFNLVYAGGDRPIGEIADQHPSTCGDQAWAAIAPTTALVSAARAAGLPIIFTTNLLPSRSAVRATLRADQRLTDDDFAIHDAFAPQPGDILITKERASAFFGTLLGVHLNRLGIQSLVVAGETTSGCVRASVVDAYSQGFHVTIAEECCFDRSAISHKVNLFDMHHKYADVMRTASVVQHLSARR